jgi:hypothetical protein
MPDGYDYAKDTHKPHEVENENEKEKEKEKEKEEND